MYCAIILPFFLHYLPVLSLKRWSNNKPSQSIKKNWNFPFTYHGRIPIAISITSSRQSARRQPWDYRCCAAEFSTRNDCTSTSEKRSERFAWAIKNVYKYCINCTHYILLIISTLLFSVIKFSWSIKLKQMKSTGVRTHVLATIAIALLLSRFPLLCSCHSIML
jgi:hypothetical protein